MTPLAFVNYLLFPVENLGLAMCRWAWDFAPDSSHLLRWSQHNKPMLRVPQITAAQVRAARALLKLSQKELAKRAGVAELTIWTLENGAKQPTAETMAAVYKVLVEGGVRFTDAGGVEPATSMEAKPEVS